MIYPILIPCLTSEEQVANTYINNDHILKSPSASLFAMVLDSANISTDYWYRYKLNEDACNKDSPLEEELIERVKVSTECLTVYVDSVGDSGNLYGAEETGSGTVNDPYVNVNTVLECGAMEYMNHGCNFPIIKAVISGKIDYAIRTEGITDKHIILDFEDAEIDYTFPKITRFVPFISSGVPLIIKNMNAKINYVDGMCSDEVGHAIDSSYYANIRFINCAFNITTEEFTIKGISIVKHPHSFDFCNFNVEYNLSTVNGQSTIIYYRKHTENSISSIKDCVFNIDYYSAGTLNITQGSLSNSAVEGCEFTTKYHHSILNWYDSFLSATYVKNINIDSNKELHTVSAGCCNYVNILVEAQNKSAYTRGVIDASNSSYNSMIMLRHSELLLASNYTTRILSGGYVGNCVVDINTNILSSPIRLMYASREAFDCSCDLTANETTALDGSMVIYGINMLYEYSPNDTIASSCSVSINLPKNDRDKDIRIYGIAARYIYNCSVGVEAGSVLSVRGLDFPYCVENSDICINAEQVLTGNYPLRGITATSEGIDLKNTDIYISISISSGTGDGAVMGFHGPVTVLHGNAYNFSNTTISAYSGTGDAYGVYWDRFITGIITNIFGLVNFTESSVTGSTCNYAFTHEYFYCLDDWGIIE